MGGGRRYGRWRRSDDAPATPDRQGACVGSAHGIRRHPRRFSSTYGDVNRSLSDAEPDAFVDALATRISSFDKWAISNTKRLVNAASLPPDVEMAAGWDACIASVARPAMQARILVRQPCNRLAWSCGSRAPVSMAVKIPPAFCRSDCNTDGSVIFPSINITDVGNRLGAYRASKRQATSECCAT